MGKRIDLTGQRFGRLIVLEDVGRTKSKKVIWRCQCECGNIVDVVSTQLLSGKTQSCGCLRHTTPPNYRDLTGQRFGRLTVLGIMERNQQGSVVWKCLCDCGIIIKVQSGSLNRGDTQSCGCLHKERLSEIHSGKNNVNWKGGITPLNDAIRHCTQSKHWKNTIFDRDSYTCQSCNDSTGGNLIAHHIVRFSALMEENHITTLEEAIQCEALWDVSNGITLCKKCHKKEHRRLKALDIVGVNHYNT